MVGWTFPAEMEEATTFQIRKEHFPLTSPSSDSSSLLSSWIPSLLQHSPHQPLFPQLLVVLSSLCKFWVDSLTYTQLCQQSSALSCFTQKCYCLRCFTLRPGKLCFWMSLPSSSIFWVGSSAVASTPLPPPISWNNLSSRVSFPGKQPQAAAAIALINYTVPSVLFLTLFSNGDLGTWGPTSCPRCLEKHEAQRSTAPALWTEVDFLGSLCPSFLICNIGEITVPFSQGYHQG